MNSAEGFALQCYSSMILISHSEVNSLLAAVYSIARVGPSGCLTRAIASALAQLS